MEWKAWCAIDELPPRLRRLAEYRKENTETNDKRCNTVGSFWWRCTDEGFEFWRDVYIGKAPSNLEEVLTAFEKEHPELCKNDEHIDNTIAYWEEVVAASQAVLDALKMVKEHHTAFDKILSRK